MRTPWIVLFLLAGCGTPGAVDDTPGGPTPPDVKVGKDAGAISGVIVDAAIRPVAGATVSLRGSDTQAQSAEDGTFVLADLPPGTYFLDIVAPGFFATQTSAQVEAGSVAKLRILLEVAPVLEPQKYTLQHSGYIQLNAGATGPLANIILDELAGSNPLCDCALRFDTTGQDVQTFVVEAVWKDNVVLPTGPTDMYLEMFPAELDDGTADIQGGFLESPILEHYPITAWGDGEQNIDWTARLSGSGYYVQYDQTYELFVTVFQNFPAPTGWSLVAGDG